MTSLLAIDLGECTMCAFSPEQHAKSCAEFLNARFCAATPHPQGGRALATVGAVAKGSFNDGQLIPTSTILYLWT